jgi:1,4-alpha-glucan branching enzyme
MIARSLMIPLLLIILSFSGEEAFTYTMDGGTAEYMYKIRFLKNADSPRQMRLIQTENFGKKEKKVISNGILFTYKNRKATDVRIAGNFSRWQQVPMRRNENGVWYYFLDEYQSHRRVIKYKYVVDSLWISDPYNYEKIDDGTGSFISLVTNSKKSFSRHLSYRILGNNRVEFRIYRPEAKFISLVGDFNNWNPENDILKKGENGVWSIIKHIPSGSYLYRYIIDGSWMQDIYNPESASDMSGDICSVIKVE